MMIGMLYLERLLFSYEKQIVVQEKQTDYM